MTRIPGGVAKALRAPGQALDAPTRAYTEELFDHDFGQVRVHTDAEAAHSAHAIRAQAYTLGRHVVMGRGSYQPHTAPGMRLLVHELTHVVQQGNPASDTGPARTISQPHDPSEREADHIAGTLAVPPRTQTSPGLLQRQDDGGSPDSGIPDAGPQDAGLPGGTPAPADAGVPNGGVPDASQQDAGPPAGTPGVSLRCEVRSGPTYTPSGDIPPVISGGKKTFPFSFAATFKNLSPTGVLASCCWVRQYIKWDQRYVDSKGGPPHAGFPSSAPVDTWIEDRDENDKRYGHRSGPHSDPIAGGGDEYTTRGVRDQAFGDTYNGKDNPQAPISRTGKWQFRLDVVDTCNNDAVKASSSVITVNFG